MLSLKLLNNQFLKGVNGEYYVLFVPVKSEIQ